MATKKLKQMITKKMKLVSKTESNGERLQLVFAEDIQQQPGQQPTAKAAVNITLSKDDFAAAADYATGKEYTITVSEG